MTFNSIAFLLFLPLVLALYHALGHRWQNRMLLAASYVFYGWWDSRFLFLIVVSTVIDYQAGLLIGRGKLAAAQRRWPAMYVLAAAVLFGAFDWNTMTPMRGWMPVALPLGTAGAVGLWLALYPRLAAMSRPRRARAALIASIAANLTILGFFKYFDFFADSAADALRAVGLGAVTPRLDVVLPVGISFYTFQTMSYTIDVYRQRMRPTTRFADFALFVAYFPQLVAGPIERAAHLLPRILAPRRITADMAARGCFLILMGFFKKIAIADGLAMAVNDIFGLHHPTFADVTAGCVFFAFQIYCDFSGYTDIARGVSKLMGIDLMVNFNLPYLATNPREFWGRWHVSLSTWLRDYLYIPLGGNRGGTWKTYRNLMLTMLLGGLWHGAAWNFVLWGAYHGALLCAHRAITGQRGLLDTDASRGWSRLPLAAGFFVLTCYGWLLFRATSAAQIATMTRALVADFGHLHLQVQLPPHTALVSMAGLIAWELGQFAGGQPAFYRRLSLPVRSGAYAAMLILILTGLASNVTGQFIYFQF